MRMVGEKILGKSTSDGVKENKASMHLQLTSGVDSKILIRLQGLKELRRMKGELCTVEIILRETHFIL